MTTDVMPWWVTSDPDHPANHQPPPPPQDYAGHDFYAWYVYSDPNSPMMKQEEK